MVEQVDLDRRGTEPFQLGPLLGAAGDGGHARARGEQLDDGATAEDTGGPGDEDVHRSPPTVALASTTSSDVIVMYRDSQVRGQATRRPRERRGWIRP
jgi:hypothetical protein